MSLDFNINLNGVAKMLELMDKSKTVKHFMWAIVILLFIYGMAVELPDIINAIASFKH